MIVKGKPRSGPAQLAAYLLRSDESAEVIELQDGGTDLHKAFMAWHTIGEASRGEKTLYHAQISPETKYPMTKEQCIRAAQILAEDLGMADHPRAVVVHQGDGRPHIHVVFQRADSETFKLWDDSFNYVKHERASLRMEKEFGMEIVPGKHAKRDREKQPEFPRQEYSEDEAQYEKRTGLSKEERVKQISALHAASDSGPAFKAALEDAGYILAQGDRGYLIVDPKGGQSVLTRNTGLKKKELEAFMAGVELDKLPTVEDAKAQQAERRKAQTVSKSDGQAAPAQEPEKKGLEASRFMPPDSAPKPPEAAPAPADAEPEALKKRKPEPVDPERKQKIIALRAWADGAQAFKKALEEAGYTLARGDTGYVLYSEDGVFSLARHAGLSKPKLDAFMSPIPLASLPEIGDLIEARKQVRPQSKFLPPEIEAPRPAKDDLNTRMEISALDMAAEAIAEAQKRQSPDPELDALQKALAKRQQEEAAALRERHDAELRAKEVELDRYIARDMENYKRIQDEQTEAFLQARQERRGGIKGLIEAIENRWNPALGAARAKEREQERRNFYRRLAKERADYEVLILQTKQQEMENLKELQALSEQAAERKHAEESERYVRDYHEAKRLREEIEAERLKEEIEREKSLGDGPPPPELGK